MGPEAAIYLVIYVIVVLGLAYAINWAADRAFRPDPTPQPLRFGIWIVAALVILLLLLNRTGVLHGTLG